MKILVVIANYGTKNDVYLQRLLQEYRSMSHDVHVVVLSNIPKHLGDDVEVVVHKPKGDPWSFPFAHKKILAERIEDYGLFIYSEDDTLITERNIDAFRRATEVLPKNEIAGFIRSEKTADGQKSLSTVHGHFHWDPYSVVTQGEYTFASFSNDHSASYLMTKSQLRSAIQSGGFLVGPHQGKYDLLVTAATDPYTQCGLKKMICISQIDDFVLPHLPNRYVGQLGLSEVDFNRQIAALRAIGTKAHPCTVLLNAETKLWHFEASKYYYESCRPEIVSLIPDRTEKVLSYGCGWGVTEAELVKKGIRVTAIPLDSVIGVCAEARGIEVVYGDSETALSRLSGDRFDCILLSDVLHLVREPERLLSALSSLLSPGGVIIASVPNLSQLPILWRRVTRQPGVTRLNSYEDTGAYAPSTRRLRKWFSRSRLRVREIVPTIPQRAKWAYSLSGRLLGNFLAGEFVLLAAKT
jgi:2-polyprenyl-3-methyl-5-hydroxy-6-metoxy-1,4-benzoquinol methylase